MNAIALMGTLQSEPELRHTQDGLARFSAMIGFSAGRAEEADYQVRIVAFGTLAEEIHKNFHHGDGILVEGRLQSETRTKPDGTKEKVTEVIARRVHSATAGAAPASYDTPATTTTNTAPANGRTATPAAVPARSARPAAPARPAEPDMDDIPF